MHIRLCAATQEEETTTPAGLLVVIAGYVSASYEATFFLWVCDASTRTLIPHQRWITARNCGPLQARCKLGASKGYKKVGELCPTDDRLEFGARAQASPRFSFPSCFTRRRTTLLSACCRWRTTSTRRRMCATTTTTMTRNEALRLSMGMGVQLVISSVSKQNNNHTEADDDLSPR